MANDEGRMVFAVAGYNPDTKEFTDFLGEFNNESDRGAVLSSTAYIDTLLAATLRAFLVDNTSAASLVRRALRSFAARIEACHAMGILSDDELNDCDLLRDVRNKFAHHPKMSFADGDVAKLCGRLKLISVNPAGAPPNNRMRFQSSAINVISKLLKRPKAVEARRLKPGSWA
jgi:mannitol operon repressor